MANRPHLWILGAAMGCFAAGMATGLVIPGVVESCCRDAGQGGDDADYVRRMTGSFGLSNEQQRWLRIVLQRFREERSQLLDHADFGQLPAPLQAELTAAQRRQSDRIYALLTPAQQAQFDEAARAGGSVR